MGQMRSSVKDKPHPILVYGLPDEWTLIKGGQTRKLILLISIVKSL